MGWNSSRVKLSFRLGRSTASRARSGAITPSASPRCGIESTIATTRKIC